MAHAAVNTTVLQVAQFVVRSIMCLHSYTLLPSWTSINISRDGLSERNSVDCSVDECICVMSNCTMLAGSAMMENRRCNLIMNIQVYNEKKR